MILFQKFSINRMQCSIFMVSCLLGCDVMYFVQTPKYVSSQLSHGKTFFFALKESRRPHPRFFVTRLSWLLGRCYGIDSNLLSLPLLFLQKFILSTFPCLFRGPSRGQHLVSLAHSESLTVITVPLARTQFR
jgi:hypothetical protein